MTAGTRPDGTREGVIPALTSDLTRDSRTLLVTMGGFAGGVGIPPFEFRRITSEFEVNTVFIRDVSQSWYHGLLDGVGRGLRGVAETLRETIRERSIERTVMVGNSMGGYAALIVGAIIGAEEVLAFSPITFIGPVARFRHGDRRWRREILRAYQYSLAGGRFFDARPAVAARRGTLFHVHYCTSERLDVAHAVRLRGFAGVELHAYERGGHELVKHLRDTGELAPLLRGAISPRGEEDEDR